MFAHQKAWEKMKGYRELYANTNLRLREKQCLPGWRKGMYGYLRAACEHHLSGCWCLLVSGGSFCSSNVDADTSYALAVWGSHCNHIVSFNWSLARNKNRCSVPADTHGFESHLCLPDASLCYWGRVVAGTQELCIPGPYAGSV